MNFILAFICGGLICFIGQFLMDKFKLMPIYITCLFVVIGGFLDFFNIYDKLIEIGYHGATIPISSFGHAVCDSVAIEISKKGFIGIFTGIFNKVDVGIVSAILFATILGIVKRPKG